MTSTLVRLAALERSALAFTVLMITKVYPPELRSTNLDTDWTWRKPLKSLLVWLAWVCGCANRWVRSQASALLVRAGRWVKSHHAPGGTLGEPWPTGSAALWAAILLAAFLLMSL